MFIFCSLPVVAPLKITCYFLHHKILTSKEITNYIACKGRIYIDSTEEKFAKSIKCFKTPFSYLCHLSYLNYVHWFQKLSLQLFIMLVMHTKGTYILENMHFTYISECITYVCF